MEHQAGGLQHNTACRFDAGALRKFYRLYQIDKDLADKQAESVKAGGSGRVIGGRSLWGNTFYLLMKEFGWSLDYILWGISFANIQMILSDTTDYFPDAKKKENKFDANDAENEHLLTVFFSQ